MNKQNIFSYLEKKKRKTENIVIKNTISEIFYELAFHYDCKDNNYLKTYIDDSINYYRKLINIYSYGIETWREIITILEIFYSML